jgi:mRNA-degrading endonuclease RelE of RelBE toxin-antitoxin system
LFDIEIRPSALAILKNLPRFTRKQLSDAMINSEKIRIETARLGFGTEAACGGIKSPTIALFMVLIQEKSL